MNNNYLGKYLVIALALAVLTVSAGAATVTWNTTEGDWWETANWDPSNTPVASDTVIVDNGGTVLLDSGSTPLIKYLYLGNSDGGSGTVIVGGNAELTDNGSAARNITIGKAAGSLGILTVKDNATVTAKGLEIATFGTGIMNVTDNAVITVTNDQVVIANNSDGVNGTLNLSGHASMVPLATGANALKVITMNGVSALNISDFANLTVRSSINMYSSNATLTLSDHATVNVDSINLGEGSTININSDQVKINTFDGNGPANIGQYGGTINLDHYGEFTFANQLGGASLAVNALSGITTLTAANTYGGATTISAGATLIAASETALGVGNITVKSNGTLALAIEAPTFQAFSSLSEDGTTFIIGGDLTVETGGILQLAATDKLSVDGDLAFDGGLVLTYSDSWEPTELDLSDLILTNSEKNIALNIQTVTATNGEETYIGTLSEGGVLGNWEVQPIPEPSTWFLLGAGLGGLALLVIRRRREDNLKI
ncbi:MAG: PEP-CTERM sorting domain-containing protein [Verrucomicrobiales bacterium]|jgi:autotransporter family porin|nr:PEP-CTERM sorting domain-containing protein [Verrucomicrobiales bacterium]